jgi:stage II sporulation protein D
MKLSWCALLIGVAAVVSACSRPAWRPGLPSSIPPAPRLIRIGVDEGGRTVIRRFPLEEYVEAAIISEFAPAGGDPAVVERMLEVQAVIGRTYALAHLARHEGEGFDLCATTHCQLFEPSRLQTSRWAPQAAAAVRRTSGSVLWYDRSPARVLFHADCGGHTSAAVDVWGGMARPYLVAFADDGPAGNAHAVWRYEAPRVVLQRALNRDSRTRIGARLDAIEVLDRDRAGRAASVALHGAENRIVRGEALRQVLTQVFGARAIKSTWFEIRLERATFVFEGRGFGHGVGLCQAGALARVQAGARPLAILELYFPGTKLISMR